MNDAEQTQKEQSGLDCHSVDPRAFLLRSARDNTETIRSGVEMGMRPEKRPAGSGIGHYFDRSRC